MIQKTGDSKIISEDAIDEVKNRGVGVRKGSRFHRQKGKGIRNCK